MHVQYILFKDYAAQPFNQWGCYQITDEFHVEYPHPLSLTLLFFSLIKTYNTALPPSPLVDNSPYLEESPKARSAVKYNPYAATELTYFYEDAHVQLHPQKGCSGP